MGEQETSPVCFTWNGEDGSLFVAIWDIPAIQDTLDSYHQAFGPPRLELISPGERRQLEQQKADMVWLR